MDRYMDIDDLGGNNYFTAEDMEYNDFLGKKYKDWKKAVEENKAAGMSAPDARKKATQDTGYGKGLEKLIALGKDVATSVQTPDGAVDGDTDDTPVTNTTVGNGGNGGKSGGGGGGVNIAGMTIPTPALIGLGVVAAYFAYKKLA